MKEDNLKLAQEDINEALSAIESIEKSLNEKNLPKEHLKEKFIFLSTKVKKLEEILIKEGILE